MFAIAASNSVAASASLRATNNKASGPRAVSAANVAARTTVASSSSEKQQGAGFVGAAVRVGAALTLSAAVVFGTPAIAQAGLNKSGNNDAYAEMMKAMEAQRCGHPPTHTSTLLILFRFLFSTSALTRERSVIVVPSSQT